MVAEDPFEKPPNGKMDCKRDTNMDRNTKDRPRVQKEGETVAHLHLLWFSGQVKRELGADGIYRFGALA